MFERIKMIIYKEFLQVFRDPKLRAVILFVPIIQIIIFGYAVTLDVKNIRTVVYDLDNTPFSREIAELFFKSGYFRNMGNIYTDQQLEQAIIGEDVRMVVHMDNGFEKAVKRSERAPLQIIVDGSDANSAGVIVSYVSNLIDSFSKKWLEDRNQVEPLISLETRAWFNPNLESQPYFVPAIIAVMISMITLTLTSMAIVREKEIGTIEQILVTPITPFEFIAGKMIPFVAIGLFDVFVILLVAIFWFEVPFRGNLSVLLTAVIFYLSTTLGLGLFISTICNTQQQAMLSAFLIYFPMALLSGFIFPINNMPEIIQTATLLNPLRHFIVIIRGVFLKGVGWTILWPEMIALACMGMIIFFLAVRRFHKTLA